jgi:hypothetical protein
MAKNIQVAPKQSEDKPQIGRLELRMKAAELRKPVMLKHWAPA